MPTDGQRLILTILFAAWVLGICLAFATYAKGGDDAVRGFLGWQGVAGLVAIAIFGVSRSWPKASPVRQLSILPIAVAALIVIGIFTVRYWARV